MNYCEEDIKSWCGHCEKVFGEEVYYCPACGSNIVNYNTAIPTEKRHDPDMVLPKTFSNPGN